MPAEVRWAFFIDEDAWYWSMAYFEARLVLMNEPLSPPVMIAIISTSTQLIIRNSGTRNGRTPASILARGIV